MIARLLAAAVALAWVVGRANLAPTEAENAWPPAGGTSRWERQPPRSGPRTDRDSASPPPRGAQEGGAAWPGPLPATAGEGGSSGARPGPQGVLSSLDALSVRVTALVESEHDGIEACIRLCEHGWGPLRYNPRTGDCHCNRFPSLRRTKR